jgi:hypothetical protein
VPRLASRVRGAAPGKVRSMKCDFLGIIDTSVKRDYDRRPKDAITGRFDEHSRSDFDGGGVKAPGPEIR